MRIEITKISMLNRKPFHTGVFHFEYLSSNFDRILIEKLLSTAKKQASTVNSGTANQGKINREYEIKIADSFVGILSEYCWKYFINLLSVDTIVTETEMETSNNQIDLVLLKNGKTAEVRSSIVRNGVNFALTNINSPFHLVGPYENEYKSHEGQKSYYLGSLLHYSGEKIKFIEHIKNAPFSLDLIGGATREMMFGDLSIEAGFSEKNVLNGTSKYRAIKFKDAFDVLEMLDCLSPGIKQFFDINRYKEMILSESPPICRQCNNPFLPRKTGALICYECWKKNRQ